MTYFGGTQMFAALKDENAVAADENTEKLKKDREIHVCECGEAVLPPDRIRCIISCVNCKESVEQVKHSVSRRIDYVVQTLRNNNVKEEHYKIHQLMSLTDDSQYKMSAEVVVEFHDVPTYEKTVNWLVEKLESSIKISNPVFYHSTGKLNDLRKKASLNALHNCRSKALSMAQLLNQTLGSPILIREDEVKELSGSSSEDSKDSLQKIIENNTVTAYVKIHAVFECKERTKRSQHK